jgi:hypothetical protein
LYAAHLNRAADQFKRKKVDATGALQLQHALIGSPVIPVEKPPTRPSTRPSTYDNMVG